jgi:hypothetical protein
MSSLSESPAQLDYQLLASVALGTERLGREIAVEAAVVPGPVAALMGDRGPGFARGEACSVIPILEHRAL